MAEFLVFNTGAYDYYGERLCSHDGFRRGGLERVTFPDREKYFRFTEGVKGSGAILIGGTVDNEQTMELYDLACGLVAQGVNHLLMVVPYYGYSTMERAIKDGEVVIGKNRALLLSSIPEARICNEVVLMDLHTAGIAHYFEGHLHGYHLMSRELVSNLIRGLPEWPNLVLASTDAGRAKWVEGLAINLGIPAAFVYKRRLSGQETEVRGINADVAGRHVVIYDDMIRTGGSLIKAARAYRDAGAIKQTAICTHAVMPGDSLERLYESGLFDAVIVTDTHPQAHRLATQRDDNFLQVHSMIPELVKFLRKDHI